MLRATKFKDIINKGKVVIDANVLLQAYQYKGIKFEIVIAQLELLAKENRLIIPSSIESEFNRNRHKLIKDMENTASNIIDNVETSLSNIKIPPTRPLIEVFPYFASSSEFQGAKDSQLNIMQVIDEYKESLSTLHQKTIDLFENDPYLERIKVLFDKCKYNPSSLPSHEDLEVEAQRRNENNIPPGYKDKGKASKDGDPFGDYMLWAHILTIKDDVLFITNDNKQDWFLKGSKGKELDLRIELLEEFNSKTGCRIKGAKSKILNNFEEYFTPLRLEILSQLKEVSMDEIYRNDKKISDILVSYFDKSYQFSHLASDVQRIDNIGYIDGIKTSHAEMALEYLLGNSTEEELKSSFWVSIDFLQDFWDSRFDRFEDLDFF